MVVSPLRKIKQDNGADGLGDARCFGEALWLDERWPRILRHFPHWETEFISSPPESRLAIWLLDQNTVARAWPNLYQDQRPLLYHLGMLALGTQPPRCEKAKPHGEVMCRGRLSLQLAANINGQPCRWAILVVLIQSLGSWLGDLATSIWNKITTQRSPVKLHKPQNHER